MAQEEERNTLVLYINIIVSSVKLEKKKTLFGKDLNFGVHVYYGVPLNILKVSVKICCARAAILEKVHFFSFLSISRQLKLIQKIVQIKCIVY